MGIFPPTLEVGDTEGFSSDKDIFGRARLDDRDRIPISAVLLGLLTVYR
jgi:hypothetical protein